MRLDPGPAIRASCALIAFAALALPATAAAQKTPSKQPQPQRAPVQPLGSLVQLNGKAGCLVDRSARKAGCTTVRALDGPGPFLGSGAVAVSPDGRHVYVASSSSDAVAIFTRNRTTGKLKQARGTAGCVARKGALGCAKATGLDGPNSLAVSPNGRSVYVTSLLTNAVLSFARNPSTGRLTQVGCVANQALPGCTAGRGLLGPDVVAVSPDSRNVYVGAFRGSTVAAFSRGSSGALEQLDGASGCVASVPIDDCSTALALGAPEGLVVSGDGANLYVANPGANALAVFARDTSSGALTQATDGSGCLANAAIAGCATAVQLAGPDAVAISPDDDQVYVTSLLSNSLTSFDRSASGQLTQKTGTSACAIAVLSVGCSLARAFQAPEGLAVSPDGANVYATAFESAAIGVFDREDAGALMQKPRRPGCVAAKPTPDCLPGRALAGAGSIAVSPDGRNAYATAFRSDAVAVFKRVTKKRD